MRRVSLSLSLSLSLPMPLLLLFLLVLFPLPLFSFYASIARIRRRDYGAGPAIAYTQRVPVPLCSCFD